MMRKILILLVIVIGIISFVNRSRLINLGTPSFKLSLKNEKPDGTAPRVEREFKMDLTGVGLSKFSRLEVAQLIQKILAESVKNKQLWQAPKWFANNYRVDIEPHTFLYRDIYLDTKDGLLYKNSLGYRLRHRWDNTEVYKEYELEPNNPKYYPYRLEYQLKTNRETLPDGTNNVTETRFEFRNESLPFSVENPAPTAPWKLSEFLAPAQRGRYKQYVTSAGHQLATVLQDKTDKKEIFLHPTLVISDERQRLHFNIKTPYGWGPNPEQVFIITLDQATFYGTGYLKFLDGYGKKPKAGGEFLQLEVEFERNVSTVIDEEIVKAKSKGDVARERYMTKVRDIFLADERMIMTQVAEGLKAHDITLVPSKYESKYHESYGKIYK